MLVWVWFVYCGLMLVVVFWCLVAFALVYVVDLWVGILCICLEWCGVVGMLIVLLAVLELWLLWVWRGISCCLLVW